jgi:hypothetical protein
VICYTLIREPVGAPHPGEVDKGCRLHPGTGRIELSIPLSQRPQRCRLAEPAQARRARWS